MVTASPETTSAPPVVVGYDGSDACLAALRWALARTPPGERVVVVGARAGDALDALWDADGDALGDDVELVVDERSPVDALTGTARELGASLIVVGHERRHGATALLHASVAHGLLEHAGVPVVVVG